MEKTFDVVLDIEKELHSITMPAFTLSQSDLDSVEITFHVNQDEGAFDLTGTTVQLAIKKPSGLTVFQNCSIVDALNGEAAVILSKQAYIEYGFYTGELMISDLDQMIVTTPFYYGVRTAIMAAQAEESINDWSALERFIFETDKKPLVVDGVPTTTPEYTGQMAVDTTGRRAFIAYDLSATGWQLIAAGEGGAGGVVYWADILGKPTTFAPAAHTHTIAEVTGLQTALDGKADVGETGGAPAAHTHAMTDITGLSAALDGKADNADLVAYAPVNHVHTFAQITEKPTTYTPSAHTHAIADVGGLQAALDAKADDTDLAGKADTGHTHTTVNITDFAAGVAANIPAEYLTVTEGDAAYQPKGTYLTAVPAEYLTQTEGDARYAIKGTEGGTVAAAWGDIAGTLSNQADLQAALDDKADNADLAGKADAGHTHTVANITDFAAGVAANIPAEYLTVTEGDAAYMPAGAAPTAHNHAITDVTGLQAALDGKADDTDLAGKADTGHTHTAANITDFGTAVAANIPAEYLTQTEGDTRYMAAGAAPAAHLHAIGDVTGLQTALDGKADDGHTHTAANITDFAAGVAANIPAEYLTVTEGDAAYQPKGTYLTAVPLARADAVGGGRVGNGLGMTGEYLHVKTGAGLGINTTNFALQVQTTRATPTALNFWHGTAAEYAAVTKDANTLYFVTG